MNIDQISVTAAGGQAAFPFPGGVSAATAAVNDASGATAVDQQLDAYHALAGRWGGAGHGERAALTHALTESPFAKTIQTAVNTFTRAAWPGADTAPPVPQQRMKEAFDSLSADHQKIIASLQVGVAGSPPPATVNDYRARLQADLDAVQTPAAPTDTVTLSPEARALLAGAAAPQARASSSVTPTPEMAPAITAYAKAGR